MSREENGKGQRGSSQFGNQLKCLYEGPLPTRKEEGKSSKWPEPPPTTDNMQKGKDEIRVTKITGQENSVERKRGDKGLGVSRVRPNEIGK